MPRYSGNTAKVGIKNQSINQSLLNAQKEARCVIQ